MKRRNKLKITLAFLTGLAVALMVAPKTAADVGERLLRERGDSIVELTPLENEQSGATGFELQLPTGRQVTVTNAHVCLLAGPNGQLRAHFENGQARPIRVLEISDKTDLCVMEGIPALPPLMMAGQFSRFNRIFVLGHPYLHPLTLSMGYPTSYTGIDVQADLSAEACTGEMYHVDPFEGGCIESVVAFESSAVIYPGNSGSPVMNGSGEVVGVMFAGNGRTNYGAFIDLEDLQKFVAAY